MSVKKKEWLKFLPKLNKNWRNVTRTECYLSKSLC